MVAVSVGESESLKLQEPFKQYVKLSKLKIYAPGVHEGLSCSCCSRTCDVETRLNTRAKQNSVQMHTAHCGYGKLAKIIIKRVAFHKFYCGKINFKLD